eukprot:scaffold212635_cov37-Tisochrysis_lutea.AAC.3
MTPRWVLVRHQSAGQLVGKWIVLCTRVLLPIISMGLMLEALCYKRGPGLDKAAETHRREAATPLPAKVVDFLRKLYRIVANWR